MLAKKRDHNEAKIVEQLIASGCTVQQLDLKDGPDLIVGYQGMNYLIEIKGDKGKVSDGQKRWHSSWRGQVAVCRSAHDVASLIGLLEGLLK